MYKILTTNHATTTCAATGEELFAMVTSTEFPKCITDYSFGLEVFEIPKMLEVFQSGALVHLFSSYNPTRNHTQSAQRKRKQKLRPEQYNMKRCDNCKAMVPVAPGRYLCNYKHGPPAADGTEKAGCAREFLRQQGLMQ